MSEASELKKLCQSGNIVRHNYYSTTYRAAFSLNGGKTQDWDIQYIRIPFDTVQEKKLKARFSLADEELPLFYNRFLVEVRQHLIALEKLKELGDDAKIGTCTLFCESRKLEKTPSGQYDIYIITEPVSALVGGNIISDSGARKSEILQIGIRLLQSVKNYNDKGYSTGTVDLDSMVVENINGKQYIKNNSFLASSFQHSEAGRFTPDLTTHMPDNIASGDVKPSYDGDIYAVCSLLWTMLSGNHFTQKPDLSRKPIYCSDAMAEVLRQAMDNGADAYRELSRTLHREYSDISNGMASNTAIPFSRPQYMSEYDRIDAATAPANNQEEAPPEKPEYIKAAGHRKIKKLLPIIAVILAAVIGSIFSCLSLARKDTMQEEDAAATPAPASTPQTESDSESTGTTSEEAGLYSYNGIVVDSMGSPTSRFYLNDEGDIEYTPSLIPTRMNELKYTEQVLDLSQSNWDIDLSEDSIMLDAETIAEYSIEQGKLLLIPNWDMSDHLRKVDSVTVNYTWENESTENNEKGNIIVLDISLENIERVANGEDWEDIFIDCIVQSTLPINQTTGDLAVAEDDTAPENTEEEQSELRAEAKEAIKSGHLKVPEEIFEVRLSDSGWYEQYQYCDDDIYTKLCLIERESECSLIQKRTSTVNGETIALYYDDIGNTYTSEEWNEQEMLRTEIENAKAELDRYKNIAESVILVPSWGVQEFAYTWEIAFEKDPLEIRLDSTAYGSAIASNFVVNVTLLPVDATCSTVTFRITPESGLTVPYSFNADFIEGEHGTYETMTEFTVDFTKAMNGSIGLAFTASEYGEYTIEATADDGRAEEIISVLVTDNAGDVPTATIEATATPSPTPHWSTYGGYKYTGSEHYDSGENNETGAYATPTATPYIQLSTPTPITTATAQPSMDNKFTVTPSTLNLQVGDTAMLSPSMSCKWRASNTSVAWIGGAQGRTVTAVKAGTCVITATSSDGQSATIVVNVTD